MPGLDRSGPMGAGPMTGGRRGLCGSRSGSSVGLPGQGNFGISGNFNVGRGPGRGFGMNRGGGRGFGRRAYGAASEYPGDMPMGTIGEMEMLRSQADYLKKSMEVINKRIEALEKENSEL